MDEDELNVWASYHPCEPFDLFVSDHLDCVCMYVMSPTLPPPSMLFMGFANDTLTDFDDQKRHKELKTQHGEHHKELKTLWRARGRHNVESWRDLRFTDPGALTL